MAETVEQFGELLARSPVREPNSASRTGISGHELRLDVVTAIIGGWIWETDAQHRFTYMSPSVERFAGRPPEWHYGKTRQELGNLNVRTADGGNWVDQLDNHVNFGPVDFVRYQNGRTLIMRTIGHPQFARDGAFLGYIGVAFELPGDAEPEPAERRGAPRRRIVRAAEIALPDESGISCVLVDLSTTGARLQVPAEVQLPESFQIKVQALSIDTRCKLRWRRNGEIGVEFSPG